MNSKLIYETDKTINDINYIITVKEDATFYTVEIRPHSEYYNYFLRYYYKTKFSHLKGRELHLTLVNDALDKARLM